MPTDETWTDAVPCYNERCAAAPHRIATVWDTPRGQLMDGPLHLARDHHSAIVMLRALLRHDYDMDDVNPRWSKKMRKLGGTCTEVRVTPQLGVPDDAYRVACTISMRPDVMQVNRRGTWVDVRP